MSSQWLWPENGRSIVRHRRHVDNDAPMTTNHTPRDAVTKAEPWIVFVGFVLGAGLSLVGLSGDVMGRVNLLYLLLIFALIPLLSMVLSLVSLFFGKGLTLARCLSWLPSGHLQSTLGKIRYAPKGLEKYWLAMQSQAAALAYAVGGLLVFFLLLLLTDLHFVWRSTLLTPEQLLPVLTGLAKPWWFWEAAQPSQDLLYATRDSRLTQGYDSDSLFSAWWPFVVALQIFYAILLRACLYGLFRFLLARHWVQHIAVRGATAQPHAHRSASETPDLPPLQTKLPSSVALVNWGQLSDDVVASLTFDTRIDVQFAVYAGSDEAELAEAQAQPFLLVLVKSWEPPMGELMDFLAGAQGCLLPVDLNQAHASRPKNTHLDEWRRFAQALPNWRVYQPAQWRE